MRLNTLLLIPLFCTAICQAVTSEPMDANLENSVKTAEMNLDSAQSGMTAAEREGLQSRKSDLWMEVLRDVRYCKDQMRLLNRDKRVFKAPVYNKYAKILQGYEQKCEALKTTALPKIMANFGQELTAYLKTTGSPSGEVESFLGRYSDLRRQGIDMSKNQTVAAAIQKYGCKNVRADYWQCQKD